MVQAAKVEAEVWKVLVPLPRAYRWAGGTFDRILSLVVVLRDAEGNLGVGYSGFSGGGFDETATLTATLVRECGPRLEALLAVERFEERYMFLGAGGISRVAANAISLAAWDLLGQREGLACADLWGRLPGKDALDSYASGFFLDVRTDGLAAEAQGYRAQGYRHVKLRLEPAAEESLARLREVQAVFPEADAIAADAVTTWDARTVQTFLAGLTSRLLWLEDPLPYEVIGAVADLGAPVAAGESCESLLALRGLFHSGVRYLLPDLSRLGGPVRFLEAARHLAALGASVGAHVYPHQSIHLLACIPNNLPVESMDSWDALYESSPRPDTAGRLPVLGPGFGARPNRETLDRHGERLTVVR
jgi:L-alanine-DL-glutamate epimerase-like enolase superfamily enzyme